VGGDMPEGGKRNKRLRRVPDANVKKERIA
jgi:hypothetical protein